MRLRVIDGIFLVTFHNNETRADIHPRRSALPHDQTRVVLHAPKLPRLILHVDVDDSPRDWVWNGTDNSALKLVERALKAALRIVTPVHPCGDEVMARWAAALVPLVHEPVRASDSEKLDPPRASGLRYQAIASSRG